MTAPVDPAPVDLTQPYAWSTTREEWVNTPCGGCAFHVPDASPETTALIARLDRLLAEDSAATETGGAE